MVVLTHFDSSFDLTDILLDVEVPKLSAQRPGSNIAKENNNQTSHAVVDKKNEQEEASSTKEELQEKQRLIDELQKKVMSRKTIPVSILSFY